MNRRIALRVMVGAPLVMVASTFSTPARAVAPPVLVALAGVAFSVAFRRYVVGAIMKTFARWFPRLFATELRRYLMAVAIAFGFSEARAADISERAEDRGAQDLARNGIARVTELKIENRNDSPLELPRLTLLLVDVSTRLVELRSTASWGLVVNANSTMHREIVCHRFPKEGLKQWYLADGSRTYAVSKPFLVIT